LRELSAHIVQRVQYLLLIHRGGGVADLGRNLVVQVVDQIARSLFTPPRVGLMPYCSSVSIAVLCVTALELGDGGLDGALHQLLGTRLAQRPRASALPAHASQLHTGRQCTPPMTAPAHRFFGVHESRSRCAIDRATGHTGEHVPAAREATGGNRSNEFRRSAESPRVHRLQIRRQLLDALGVARLVRVADRLVDFVAGCHYLPPCLARIAAMSVGTVHALDEEPLASV
jgi:hypothetical protein